jgi:hypothetical protein
MVEGSPGRSAPQSRLTGTLVTGAWVTITVLRVAGIATWACTVPRTRRPPAAGRCLLRRRAWIVVAAAWC